MTTYTIEPYINDSGSLMTTQDIVAIDTKRALEIAHDIYPEADYFAVIDIETGEMRFTDDYIDDIQ